jgi:NAD(P)-dependent dehydrogenase (short-subunit alcohol dehydrogenase family)
MTDANIFGLKGKVALIVGGGEGLGESAARFLSGAGCSVAVADLDAGRAQGVVDVVRERGGRGMALVADVLNDADLERIVAETEAAFGGLDVVVSIVGASKFGGVLELTAEDWDRDQARNLRYVFFLAQAAARSFVRRGVPGVIVAIATAGASGSMPFRSAYGAAKAGLVHLVRSLAVVLGEYGIRVNAAAPGMTVTPRTAARMGSESTQAEIRKIPLQKLGAPDDVGKAVLFLASDLASHITGATLPVDGGSSVAPNYDLEPSRAASRRNRLAMGREPRG